MPGGFPLLGDVCNAQAIGATTTTSYGTVVTGASTQNTKGLWTQLIAATAADCVLVEVSVFYDASGVGAGPPIASVDIGIGASGSEIVLIPDIVVAPFYLQGGLTSFLIPLNIPAGTRIAARVQTVGATSQVLKVSINTYDGSFEMGEGGAGVDTMGFLSASTAGTFLTSSATANTKGSYTQIIASTSRDYMGLCAAFDRQEINTSGAFLCDIAIGGSGSEQIILPNRFFAYGTSAGASSSLSNCFGFIPIRIPAGTRVSARCQTDHTAAQKLGVTLYGVF